MVFLMLACTDSDGDSGTFTPAERDTVAEECSAWTGIVGLGTTWTYVESEDTAAAGTKIDMVARITYVEGPDVKREGLWTTTTGLAPPDDTGDTAAQVSGEGETTTLHTTDHYRCDADGLHLESEGYEQFTGTNLGGSASSSGTRTYTSSPLVLPFDPAATPSWSATFAGTSNYAGEASIVDHVRSCTATAAATIDTGLGTLSGIEVVCAGSDDIDSHSDRAFYASNAGRVRDATVILAAYSP